MSGQSALSAPGAQMSMSNAQTVEVETATKIAKLRNETRVIHEPDINDFFEGSQYTSMSSENRLRCQGMIESPRSALLHNCKLRGLPCDGSRIDLIIRIVSSLSSQASNSNRGSQGDGDRSNDT